MAEIDRYMTARKSRTHQRASSSRAGAMRASLPRLCARWLTSAGKDRPPKSAGSTRLVFLLLLSGAPRACFLRAVVSYKPPGRLPCVVGALRDHEERAMKRLIGAALVAGVLALGGPAAIDPAAAASPKAGAQAIDVSKATDLSARRGQHYHYGRYDRPYYLDRPTYYRPYPYYTPAPFTFGFGFGPGWW